MSVLQIFCQEKRTFESPSIEQAQRFSYHFVKIWNRTDRHSNIISNFASLQKFELKILQNKFSCPHCPMVMKTSTLIKRHILIHTGEKPFSCEFCQYSANRKEHLKSHNFSKHNVVLWTINISSFEIKLHFFWILEHLLTDSFFKLFAENPNSSWSSTIWLSVLSKDHEKLRRYEKTHYDSYWRETVQLFILSIR